MTARLALLACLVAASASAQDRKVWTNADLGRPRLSAPPPAPEAVLERLRATQYQAPPPLPEQQIEIFGQAPTPRLLPPRPPEPAFLPLAYLPGPYGLSYGPAAFSGPYGAAAMPSWARRPPLHRYRP
jgi:hypothetical protein